ncbi:MAG: DNA polymerase III subunit beta [Alphaproteobacteria bacterium]
MKVSIERNAFLKALNHCHSIVERRTTLPILSHVLLNAEGMSLKLNATDLELSVIETVSATVVEPGRSTVSAHLLHEIVKKFRDGSKVELSMNKDTNQIEVSCGKSKFQLPFLPPEDFPIIKTTDSEFNFSLPPKTLKRLFDKTRIAMATEETRYFLCGVYLHTFEDRELRAAATDGHRLARVSVSLPEGARGMPGIIISRKTVNEFSKILTETNDDIQVGVSETQITFTMQNAQLVSRLIDGQYPNYEDAIPDDTTNSRTMHVKVKPFFQAVDRVATIANDQFSGIKLSVDDNRLTLSAINEESGQAREEIEVDYSSPEVTIGFSSRYLMDVTQQLDQDEAQLAFADNDSPIVIRPCNDDTSLFVLMPLRV